VDTVGEYGISGASLESEPSGHYGLWTCTAAVLPRSLALLQTPPPLELGELAGGTRGTR
jgi:hypothetical protein